MHIMRMVGMTVGRQNQCSCTIGKEKAIGPMEGIKASVDFREAADIVQAKISKRKTPETKRVRERTVDTLKRKV